MSTAQMTDNREAVFNSMKWMLRHFIWEQYQLKGVEYSPELKAAIKVFESLAQELGKCVRYCPFCNYPMSIGTRSCPVCNEDIAKHYS